MSEHHSHEVTAEDLAERFLKKTEDLEVNKYFRALVKLEGSDLHMKVGRPPIVRVHGQLRPLNRGPIDSEEMVRLLFPLMNKRTRAIFDEDGGCDFAHVVDVDGTEWRFRVNMLQQMGRIGLVARRINNWIPDFEGLHLPPVIVELCKFDQGMILLAGVTGSGKSTTIASMLNWINRNYAKHILTLEDPIEFLFTEEKCLINQREIGHDVKDFKVAMKHAVREDPDVILVGELRDAETIRWAMTAAETGHLVLGTLHTTGAVKTIDRIIDALPADEREQTKSFLSQSLIAVITQVLVKTADQRGRKAMCEIMVVTRAIGKLIMTDQTHQIPSQLQTGKQLGMQLLDQALLQAIVAKEIDPDDAYVYAQDKKLFARYVTDTSVLPKMDLAPG